MERVGNDALRAVGAYACEAEVLVGLSARITAVESRDLPVKRVEVAPGHIAIATFLELRSAYKRGRITPGVFDWIAGKLENDHRIGVMADSSEPSQEQEAYLYELDAPVGGLLAAVSNPSDAGLRRLREVATPAQKAVESDASLATVKAALEDATVALQDYLGENGET